MRPVSHSARSHLSVIAREFSRPDAATYRSRAMSSCFSLAEVEGSRRVESRSLVWQAYWVSDRRCEVEWERMRRMKEHFLSLGDVMADAR